MSLMSRRPQDPSTSLKKLFNIPLQHDVSDHIKQKIVQLNDITTKPIEEVDWLVVYEQAVTITNQIVDEIEEQEEQIQQETLLAESTFQNKKKEIQAQKKQVDKKFRSISQEVSRISKEWKERLKRQADQLNEESSVTATKGLTLQTVDIDTGKVFEIYPTWWEKYNDYVTDCCNVWSRDFCAKATKELNVSLQQTIGEICGVVNTDILPEVPLGTTVDNLGRLSAEELPTEKVVIPSTAAALMGYMRTHIMTVGIFATLVGGLAVVGQAVVGGEGSGNTMMIRGMLMAGVLPLLIGFGWVAVKKQRQQTLEKAEEKEKEKAFKHVRKATKASYDKHRGGLQRWLEALANGWESSLKIWNEETVQPILQETQSQIDTEAGKSKLTRSKRNEKEFALKIFRKTTKERLLFELKKDLARHQ